MVSKVLKTLTKCLKNTPFTFAKEPVTIATDITIVTDIITDGYCSN